MAERTLTLPASVSTRRIVAAGVVAAAVGVAVGSALGVPWASASDAGTAPTVVAATVTADPSAATDPAPSPPTTTPTTPPAATAAPSSTPAPSPADAAAVPRREPLAVDPLPTTTSPEGWTVAGGSSVEEVGDDDPVVRWTLEVEPATGLDIGPVLATAEDALYDPRSWARDHRLERVDDPAQASIRVLVATPATVDRLCAQAGLVTNGAYSCWNGRFAAITERRWRDGASEVRDLDLYRAYVVNHEVGHGLGRGHADCSGAGDLADVMQQQTRTLDGCVANPWPYPDATD